MQLVKYDAACRAIAAARTIDEVKEITNRAEAARAYARQAKNRQMEIDAIEIRTRAERRLGEIIIDLKNAGIGKQGLGPRGRARTPEAIIPVRLQDLGIDPNISAGAQRLAMLPSEKFEAEMADWRIKAPAARRFEVPLQIYRFPTIRSDRQRASQRLGRMAIDYSDRFTKYRAPDGRRIADWRIGELPRLADAARRYLRCVEALCSSDYR